jgi:hypothetical protein
MWSLFGKIMSYDFPDRYAELVTKDQYNDLLKKLISNFKIRGIKNSYQGDGVFAIKYDKYEGQFVMDNLIRTVIKQEQSEWENEISKFLDKFHVDENYHKNVLENFEMAKPLLRILIKPNSFDLSRPDSKQIARTDFPETYSLLTLELDGQFLFLTENDIKHWNKSIPDLYKTAIEYIPYNEIKGNELKIEFGTSEDFLMLYLFTSGDFAASAMLDLPNGAAVAIGKFGSLVAIPSKGKAYCHPIEGGNILRLTKVISQLAEKDFKEDPGNINTNFYWIYKDKIELFPKSENTEFVCKLPDRLLDLLRPN